MTAYDNYHSFGALRSKHGLLTRIEGAVAHVRRAAAKRAIYRRTVAELSALSMRELNDIGLSRAMIRSVALEEAAKL